MSPERVMRCFSAALALAIAMSLRAQDLEPRAYSNSPIGLNFAIAGYAYAKGDVLTDPSLPLENVSNDSHVGVVGFATTFRAFSQSGKVDVIVPYASLAAKGLVFGLPREREVTGFADPAFRLSLNLIGAPALTAAEFKNYRQNFILGMSLRVTAPLGQYDGDKLVNIGTNRWSFKPEIGFSKAFGKWTVEVAPAATIYTGQQRFLRRPDAPGRADLLRAVARQLHISAGRLGGGECRLLRGRPHDGGEPGEQRRTGRHALWLNGRAAGEPLSFRETLRHHRIQRAAPA